MHALKKSMTGLGIASAFWATSPAMALDRGCQNADTVRTALRDEGQYVLVTGEATNDQRSRNIFTSNENGSLGYNIEQGSSASQLCVVRKYTDVRVNTNLDSSTPPFWTRYGAGTQNDRYFDSAIRGSNARVFLGARVLTRQEDGSEARGVFMTVARGDGFGSVVYTRNDGTIIPDVALANLAPQQPNYANFQGRTRDAEVQP